jgi:hypothetical protein
MAVTKATLIACVALLFVAVSGCKKGEGGTCFEASECDEGLGCIGDALRRCEKCDSAEVCRVDGRCSAKDGLCTAASDDDCKKGYVCTGKGGCTAKDGHCVVGGDADCQQSEACKNDGFCKSKGNNCIKEKKDEPKPAEPVESAEAIEVPPDTATP